MLRQRGVDSPRRRWLRRIALWLGAVVTVGALALAWLLYFAPLPASLIAPQPPLTSVYTDVKGRIIAEIPSDDARSHRPISLGEMGPWIPKVTVSLEDRRFYDHSGVDVRACLRALLHRRGGGSTITQQYVKIATGRRGRSLWIKAFESLRALQLERHWSKAQILEAYLNRLPYGNRLTGIEAAARAYFEKPASALTQAESIFLAGLPRAPTRLNPWRRPNEAARQFTRSLKVLAAHRDFESLPPADGAVPVPKRNLPANAAPHFVQIASKRGERGLIRCTLDLDLQRRAEQLVRDHLQALHRPDITQAALVVIDNETGGIRALVGSRDFTKCQINGALKFRNCGSTLKPLLYAAGIESRLFTAATLFPDTADAARDAFADYDPHNFILTHLGPVRLREALGNSLNVPAVVALNHIGPRKAYNAIEDWGIRFDQPLEKAGAGFILGNVGVRLVDLTAAFSALSRGGLVIPPRFRASDPMPRRRTLSAQTAEIITDILCDNSARLHSFGRHSVISFPVRVAAKTGTSAAFRDAWTVGFTREHTVGVWVGNFDGSPMNQAGSVAAAGPLWRRMIDDLLLTDHPLPPPTLPRTSICSLSGLRPTLSSPAIVNELFLPGTEPRESAEAWFDDADGTPLLPNEYAGWCTSADNFLHARVRPDARQLTILSPRDGSVFIVDRSVPRLQQQLEIVGSGSTTINWTINGEPLHAQSDGRILWPLHEGEWTLEASSAEARASHRFVVRRE